MKKISQKKSTKSVADEEKKREPQVLKQPRWLREQALTQQPPAPDLPKKQHPFVMLFHHTRTAILTACPKNGICLIRLQKKGDTQWHNALQRFLDLLVEMGHIFVDDVTQRIRTVKHVVRQAGHQFYDQLISNFLPA